MAAKRVTEINIYLYTSKRVVYTHIWRTCCRCYLAPIPAHILYLIRMSELMPECDAMRAPLRRNIAYRARRR